jgi:hypothetical protein
MHETIFNPTAILVNETRQIAFLDGLFNWLGYVPAHSALEEDAKAQIKQEV